MAVRGCSIYCIIRSGAAPDREGVTARRDLGESKTAHFANAGFEGIFRVGDLDLAFFKTAAKYLPSEY